MSANRTTSPGARTGSPGAHRALGLGDDKGDIGSADFHLRVLSSDDRSIVYVRGELDAYTAAGLRDSLAGLISAGARHIVVDLGQLSFMGASGLGVLVGASRRLRRDDGRLLLRSAPPGVQKMLEITGLDATLGRR